MSQEHIRYVGHTSDGQFIAFFDAIVSPPPKGTLVFQIDVEIWNKAIERFGHWKIADGEIVFDDASYEDRVLDAEKHKHISTIREKYHSRVRCVEYTSSFGVAAMYKFGDTKLPSGSNAYEVLKAVVQKESSWTAGAWVDSTGKPQQMTFNDMKALLKLADNSANSVKDEQLLIKKIAEVHSAKTIDDVHKVIHEFN